MADHSNVKRRPLPEPTKRLVRQRCGFGCVICGNPLIEYDHLVPFAEGGSDHASNLTLLCTEHHAKKTRGLLSEDAVIAADAQPFNRGDEGPSSLRVFEGVGELAVLIGTCLFESHRKSFAPLGIFGTFPLTVTLEDGVQLVSCRVVDELGRIVIEVERNELIVGASNWDATLIGSELTIRRALGGIALRVQFDPSGVFKLLQANLEVHGYRVIVDGDGVYFPATENRITGGTWRNGDVGFFVGELPPGLRGIVQLRTPA